MSWIKDDGDFGFGSDSDFYDVCGHVSELDTLRQEVKILNNTIAFKTRRHYDIIRSLKQAAGAVREAKKLPKEAQKEYFKYRLALLLQLIEDLE